MKQIRLLFLFILIPFLSFANMAQPWIPGSFHSTLYGAKNCQVIRENIFIDLTESEDAMIAKFKIKYVIHSDADQAINLLFIGIALDNYQTVIVNGKAANILDSNLIKASAVHFSERDSIAANSKDLIYFNANLHKGENTISVAYEAGLGFNTYGFEKRNTIEYSLYPSRFWKSFGTITIEMPLQNKYKIVESNIGNPKIKNDIAKWEINSIDIDTIEVTISKKTNFIASILLSLQPIGIAILFVIAAAVFHTKLIRKKYEQKNKRLKYVLSLGNFIIPILFYVVFFSSFPLIDFSLGQEYSKHGYVFLYVFTYPVFVLIYGLVMLFIDRNLREKYNEGSKL